jgi:uroporphyrinogen decarboxylase
MAALSTDNSHDLVKRALEFRRPERVPVHFFAPRHSDIALALIPDRRGWHGMGMSGEDEWGCTWTTVDRTMGRVTQHPLSRWDQLDAYPWPDFTDPTCYDLTRWTVANAEGRYVLAELPANFFERPKQLRGDTEFLLDLRAEPQRVEDLLQRMEDTSADVVRRFARLGAHGILMTDDWGMQDRLWIDPALWRRIFKPRYAALVRVAHEEGMHFILHSCGYISDIIEDLVEVGLDCLQLDQPDLLGIDALAERFGGRICFYCPVDIQTTLVSGTREEIESAARRLMFRLGNYGGGFIGKEYPQPFAIDLRQDNIDVMYRAFLEHGRYPLPLA